MNVSKVGTIHRYDQLAAYARDMIGTVDRMADSVGIERLDVEGTVKEFAASGNPLLNIIGALASVGMASMVIDGSEAEDE